MLRPEAPSLSAKLRSQVRPADWCTSVLLLVTIVLLLASYDAVVQSLRWLPQALLIAALVLTTCAVLRRFGAAFPWIGGAIVWLVGLIWLFASSSTFALLPSTSSLGALWRLLSDGLRVAWIEQPPVADTRPVLFLVAAGFGLLALLLDFVMLGLRRVVLAGALLLGVYIYPSAVTGDQPNLWVFIGVAAVWLLLLRIDTRHRQGATSYETASGMLSATVVAVAALALSIALPPMLPRVPNLPMSWANGPHDVFDRGVNPMVELGQNLRRGNPVQALTYTTTGQQAPYLKVANLLDFNGKVWRPSSGPKFAGTDGLVTLAPDVKRTLVNTDITITGLRSSMLPVPYPSVRAQGATGRWRWNSQGLTLSSATDTSENQHYRASSLWIEPTLGQLEASHTVISPDLEPYIQLPSGIDPVIARTARAATVGTATAFDRALALQEFFRNSDFTYSETAPVSAGYDGSGVTVIAKFLKAKSGYCVHFASAMAVMARTLGIPARIAVGYAPGEPFGHTKSGAIVYEVTSRDLHAWPELFFAGIGWLSFDPTPGVGSPDFDPAVAPGAHVSPDRLAQLATMAARNRPDGTGFSSSSAPTASPTSAYRPIAATLGGLLIIGLGPLWVRRWQRRRRMRRCKHSADWLWAELECSARDYGMFVTAAESPRAFAAELAQRPGIDSAALMRMRNTVEQERYGPGGSARSNVADLRAVLTSLRAGASRAERIRATLLPASLTGHHAITTRHLAGR